ncbi:MAG TPA: carbohydrate kinase family protein [Vicinamibacterales bacterium]|nr:carbohydrate kinase family protein [Vicinamibacterales bacterium]
MRIPLTLAPPAARAFDVVGLGLNSVDLLAVVAEFPANNSKQRLQRFARLPGGPTATTLAGCARLGWRTRYLGAFGDDEHGRMARESLVQEGVDVSGARVVADARNQFAVILVDGTSGERTVLWDHDPALDLAPETWADALTTSGRTLIVDGYEPAAASRAARAARAAGLPTAIDIERVRPGVADLLREIDIVIAAEEFPSELTGHEATGAALARLAAECRPAVACVTLGRDGSLAICQGREIRTPAYHLSCVDTTGAGDAFRAGFLSGWLRDPDGDLEQILEYANAVAALNCRALGAQAALPRPDEVDRLVGRGAGV